MAGFRGEQRRGYLAKGKFEMRDDKQQQIADGRQLRRKRRAAGLLQKEIAQRFSVGQTTVSCWELGTTKMPECVRRWAYS